MPIRRDETKGNVRTIWNEYSPNEIERYWYKEGQGRRQSIERDDSCVIVPCSNQEAREWSCYFINNIFAIPTCTHYDGYTISLYCGDAGKGWRECFDKTKEYIDSQVNNRKPLIN